MDISRILEKMLNFAIVTIASLAGWPARSFVYRCNLDNMQKAWLLRLSRLCNLCATKCWIAEALNLPLLQPRSQDINAAAYAGYLIAGANNALIAAGAIVGNHDALTDRGSDQERTRGGGAAGLCDAIAGSINMTVPFTTRVVAYLARHNAYQSACRQLDCAEPAHLDKLHADEQAFHALIAPQPQLSVHGVVGRDSIFAKQAAIFDQHEALPIGSPAQRRQRHRSDFAQAA